MYHTWGQILQCLYLVVFKINTFKKYLYFWEQVFVYPERCRLTDNTFETLMFVRCNDFNQ